MLKYTVEVFELAYKIMNDSSATMVAERAKNVWNSVLTAFAEDRGLFYMVGIGTAMEYRYMESDFGILPIPKYNEEQPQYYTSFSKYNSGCIAIPISCLSTNEAGFILQATCLASTNTLRTTFYDTVLNGVTVRDTESSDMLDILFANRVFDMVFLNNWGGMADLYTSLLGQDSSNLASSYVSKEKVENKALDKAVKQYGDLD